MYILKGLFIRRGFTERKIKNSSWLNQRRSLVSRSQRGSVLQHQNLCLISWWSQLVAPIGKKQQKNQKKTPKKANLQCMLGLRRPSDLGTGRLHSSSSTSQQEVFERQRDTTGWQNVEHVFSQGIHSSRFTHYRTDGLSVSPVSTCYVLILNKKWYIFFFFCIWF